jgi:hypothetical protein
MTETTPETLLADTRAALATARSELETLLAVQGPRTEADTLGPTTGCSSRCRTRGTGPD